MIGADDRGFLLGDGLFETVLWDGGALIAFDAHAARLIAGCATMGLPPPAPSALRVAAAKAIADAHLSETRAAVRLTWTAGPGGRGLARPTQPTPRLIASAAPSLKPTTPVRLIISSVRRNEGSPASRLKSLAYLDNILARREAAGAGADEAVMLNNRGEIACASAANLFWFEGETLVTPALDCGVLDGIMRTAVMARARGLGWIVREDAADRRELARASGLFLTNSLTGVRTVAALDGAPMPRNRQLEGLLSGTPM